MKEIGCAFTVKYLVAIRLVAEQTCGRWSVAVSY